MSRNTNKMAVKIMFKQLFNKRQKNNNKIFVK